MRQEEFVVTGAHPGMPGSRRGSAMREAGTPAPWPEGFSASAAPIGILISSSGSPFSETQAPVSSCAAWQGGQGRPVIAARHLSRLGGGSLLVQAQAVPQAASVSPACNLPRTHRTAAPPPPPPAL